MNLSNFLLTAAIIGVSLSSCSKQSPTPNNALGHIENLRADFVPSINFVGITTFHNLNMKFDVSGNRATQFWYRIDGGLWTLAGWHDNQNVITGIPGNHTVGVRVEFYGGSFDSVSRYFKGI